MDPARLSDPTPRPRPLSMLDDYELVNSDQDIRGRELRDPTGRLLGRINDFLIDTRNERVESLVLDDGTTYPVRDVTITDNAVLLDHGAGRRSLPSVPHATPAAAMSTPSAMSTPAAAAAMSTTAAAMNSPSAPPPPTTGIQTGSADALPAQGTPGRLLGALSLPVIEEQLRVSKRPVTRGGVQVTTHLDQHPVQEEVTLREEHVHVDRFPVDQPLASTAPFEERSIDIIEHAEEAVVTKEARVVEEVIVTKDVEQREAQVNDTVRRTEVAVSPLPSFDAAPYADHYQEHFAATGQSLDEISPAYHLGHTLRGDERFSGQDWASIEPAAQQEWEERSPGTWEKVKAAVRHAWERIKA